MCLWHCQEVINSIGKARFQLSWVASGAKKRRRNEQVNQQFLSLETNKRREVKQNHDVYDL